MVARRLVLAVLVLVCGLGVFAGSALAAAPEAPTLELLSRSAESVSLRGVLNPGQESEEAGEYRFLYKASKTNECAGGGETPVAAYSMAQGQEVFETISSLVPGTEYAVCLSASSLLKHETVVSAEVTVTTAIAPEPPVDEEVRAGSITATSAEVEGELNPLKGRVSEPGTYEFIYRVSALSEAPTGQCESEATPAVTASGAMEERVVGRLEDPQQSEEELRDLQPNAKYTVCLRVHNEAGEEATGSPVTFATLAAPPKIKSESVSGVRSSEARLEGVVNPNNQLTECHIQYGLASGSVTEHEVLCEPEVLKGFGEQGVGANVGELEAAKAYKFRIVVKNGKGEEEKGTETEFKRVAEPPERPETTTPENITNTTAELRGVLNPAGASNVSWYFEYAPGASCTGPGVLTTPVEGPEEVLARGVEAKLTGLSLGTGYTVCLVAENEAKEQTRGSGVSFTTSALEPAITEESFSGVSDDAATVTAQINDEGLPATYRVQYGPSSAYGSETPVQHLLAGEDAVAVSVQFEGLTPHSEYHFRVVAESDDGTTEAGPDATFKTLPSENQGLPDGRIDEMVTPLEDANANVFISKAGNSNEPIEGVEGEATKRLFQVAANGEAVAYISAATLKGGTGNDQAGGGNEQLATRSEQGGWTQVDIRPEGYVRGTAFKAFSSELSTGIVFAVGADEDERTPLSAEVPEELEPLYARSSESGVYHPLFTHVPAGTTKEATPLFAGASADFSQLLFAYDGALTENAPAGGEDLYDSVGGRPILVNVLPNGTPETNATFGGLTSGDAGEKGLVREHNGPALGHVISPDGSRIFWTDLNTGDLYVRENAASSDATTVQVDASEGPGPSGGGDFKGASNDGSQAFFTDESKLTSDSTAAPGEPDLYDYEVNDEAGKPGRLTDLTVDQHSGEAADVQGVVAISENGEYVYFVADGALAPGAKHVSCESSEEYEYDDPSQMPCNLYVYHDGETRFIAALSKEDGTGTEPYTFQEGRDGDWQGNLGHRTAAATSDGKALMFMSNQSLTGYDNEGEINGAAGQRGLTEEYVYEFDSARLVCVSCSSSGEPPSANMVGAAGFVPISYAETYLPRPISDVGGHVRVFFNSAVPLVAQDTNGKQDVYEWEADGAGSCEEASGCTYLLSGGASEVDSWLLGASETGDDVFIITRAQLVPEDHNETFNVFDARVGGVRPISPPACTGTGCQGVPSAPPPFATPASVTFSGVGNFPPPSPPAPPKKTTKKKATKCAKGQKLSRRKCVKAKPKHKKTKRAKQASDDRRGK